MNGHTATIRAALVDLIRRSQPKSENDARGPWYVNDNGDSEPAMRFGVKVEDAEADTRHALAYEATLDEALDAAAKALVLIEWVPKSWEPMSVSAAEAVALMQRKRCRTINGKNLVFTVEASVCSTFLRANPGLERDATRADIAASEARLEHGERVARANCATWRASPEGQRWLAEAVDDDSPSYICQWAYEGANEEAGGESQMIEWPSVCPVPERHIAACEAELKRKLTYVERMRFEGEFRKAYASIQRDLKDEEDEDTDDGPRPSPYGEDCA